MPASFAMRAPAAIFPLLMLIATSGSAEAAESRRQETRSDRAAEIPMKLSHSGHLEVRGRINGEPVLLVVDTGSPRVVLDASRSARLKLPPGVRGQDAQGLDHRTMATELTSVQTMTFGRFTIRDASVLLLDLKTVNHGREARDQIDGIIGLDLLRRYRAVIDVAKMRLILRSP